MGGSPYDIYVVEHVEAMKAENARLNAMVGELSAENAELSRKLDRFRRAAAYGDDYEWTNKDWRL